MERKKKGEKERKKKGDRKEVLIEMGQGWRREEEAMKERKLARPFSRVLSEGNGSKRR